MESVAVNHEDFEVGCLVRSYDFEGNDTCYVEGYLMGYLHPKGSYRRYNILVTKRMWSGKEDPMSKRATYVTPPVNGTKTVFGDITNCVKMVE